MARIKIDIANGIFEAEGDESFLNNLYSDFKQGLVDRQDKRQLAEGKDSNGSETHKSVTNKSEKKSIKPTGKRKESYSIVKDLDLSAKSGNQSLRDMYAEKQPGTGMERATFFVYYLKNVTNISNVTPDHIYTCYKEVGTPVPKALRQSLLDTAHRKGSIDTSDLNDITLTTVGENLVEYDLPGKKETK